MKYILKRVSIFFLLAAVFSACQPEIDDYFFKDTQDEYVDSDVLSLLKKNPDYSSFVEIIEELEADTIINNGNSFTLFVPKNDAIASMDPSISKLDLFNYLVTESYININQIGQSTLLQSYGGKFVQFEVIGDSTFKYDGVKVVKGSPLTNNGRYYELEDIVVPRPNIYEYFTRTNPFFQAYFDSEDSTYLDLFLSTPLYFNEHGQTVYDSVMGTVNRFELDYFPISEEFRNVKATMLVFSEQQYKDALDEVTSELGMDSIPEIWQKETLMPYVLERSVFRNALNYSAFDTYSGRAKNINNDSVFVEIEKIDPNFYDCSNGRVFNYIDFSVPEELYKVADTVYLSDRLYKRGKDSYDWGDEFVVTGTRFTPQVSDNRSLIVDMESKDFDGEFSFEYKHYNIFPGTYRLKLKVNILNNIGIWKIFVNDQQVPVKYWLGDFWEYDLYNLREGFISALPSETAVFAFYPFATPLGDGRTCVFEALVDNVTDFGDVDVRLEYVGRSPKSLRNAGINIEFASLEYYEE